MVDLTVILIAKNPGRVSEIRKLLATQVTLSRKEPGCVKFDAFESRTEVGTFIVVERWESQAALDDHRQASAIKTVYVPQILPLVERHLHVCRVLPGT